MAGTFPELRIEQAAIGELSQDEERKYEAEPGFSELVELRRLQNEDFLRAYPTGEFAEKIEARLRDERDFASERRRQTIRSLGFGASGLAAAAVLTFFFLPTLQTQIAGSEDSLLEDAIRVKGLEPQLSVYLERPSVSDGYEELAPGATVRPNDRIQIAFNPGGYAYGVILSIDGRGVVTLHYPASASASVRFESSGSVNLPYAYQLDDAPLFERILFITSNEDFDTLELIRTIRDQLNTRQWTQDGILNLPEDFLLTAFPLRK